MLTLAGNSIEPREVHELNVLISTLVTVSAILIELMFVQPINAYEPILVTPLSISTEVILLLYFFHGTLSLDSQLTIFPEPLMVSFPPLSSQLTFVPQTPDSPTLLSCSAIICGTAASDTIVGLARLNEKLITAAVIAAKNFLMHISPFQTAEDHIGI